MSARMALYVGRGAIPADIALSLIPSLPRATLERLAQRIIDHLDDAEAEAEDIEDDDPAGMMDEDELTTGPRVMATHGVTYDGEDGGAVILHAPKGFAPTAWGVS